MLFKACFAVFIDEKVEYIFEYNIYKQLGVKNELLINMLLEYPQFIDSLDDDETICQTLKLVL